jgi:hypothetical protein
MNFFDENAEHRVTVSMRVDEARLAQYLPKPWQINIPTEGINKGFDVQLEFRDRILDLDEHRRPVVGGSERGLVILVPAKNPETGEAGLRVIREFTANPNFLPGLYNNSKLISRMHLAQSMVANGTEPGIATELWELEEPGGGVASLRFQYERGIPRRVNRTYNMYGSDDPKLTRIYKTDQGRDTVIDVAAGINRTHNFALKMGLAEFAHLFDGSERMISVETIVWYVREVFIP